MGSHTTHMKVPVPFVTLSEGAIPPNYQSELASGFDFHACLPEGKSVVVPVARLARIPTGLGFAVPAGYELQVRPRSGLAAKNGITVLNTPGTVDADYRGEVIVLLHNNGVEDFVVSHGDRIAQGVIAPVMQADLRMVAELDETERGTGGFGSTGIAA